MKISPALGESSHNLITNIKTYLFTEGKFFGSYDIVKNKRPFNKTPPHPIFDKTRIIYEVDSEGVVIAEDQKGNIYSNLQLYFLGFDPNSKKYNSIRKKLEEIVKENKGSLS